MFKRLTKKFVTLLASRRFYHIVLVFFVVEALWFVFSALYPMAFDEEYHLGLIRIYSDHWLPFLTSQPEGADVFGAVARDPSYFFHYAMSFPYRFIALFSDNQTVQVIALRLINVAIFTTSLVLFRQVVLRLKASLAFAHLGLALFALIPIVPMLAAHISYDNLFVLATAVLLLLAFDVIDGFKERKIAARPLVLLLVVAMLTTLVKYAALPIVLGVFLYVAYAMVQAFWGRFRSLGSAVAMGLRALSRPVVAVLVCLFVLSGVLFAQRYGVNLVRYHSPVPRCEAVLTIEQCKHYGPWARNYRLAQRNHPHELNIVQYVNTWWRGMHYRLFFAVNGPTHGYATRLQLPLPAGVALVLLVTSSVLVAVYWRRIFRGNTHLALAATAIIVYTAVLFANGYKDYLETSAAVAINGRYFVPLLLPMAVIAGQAWKHLLGRRAQLKAVLAALVLLCFLQGGGVLTFIMRSDETWDWPNQTVVNVNDAVRNVLKPIIIEGKALRDN